MVSEMVGAAGWPRGSLPVQTDSVAVQARGEEVVNRQFHAGGVQLFEDRADAADRLGVGFVHARKLDERNLERLERCHRRCPG